MKYALVYDSHGAIAAVLAPDSPLLECCRPPLLVIERDLADDKAEGCRRGAWLVKAGKFVKAPKSDERPEVDAALAEAMGA